MKTESQGRLCSVYNGILYDYRHCIHIRSADDAFKGKKTGLLLGALVELPVSLGDCGSKYGRFGRIEICRLWRW